jgi:hypothetical protein
VRAANDSEPKDGEDMQESLALLEILAIGNREIEEGAVKPIAEVVRRLRDKIDTTR